MPAVLSRFNETEQQIAATLAAAIIGVLPNTINKGGSDPAIGAAKLYIDCLEAIEKERNDRQT
jgi:hypothetical protein